VRQKSTRRIPERFVEPLIVLGIVVIDQAVGGLDAAGRTHLICRRTDLVESSSWISTDAAGSRCLAPRRRSRGTPR
jgi:hypothetical protein